MEIGSTYVAAFQATLAIPTTEKSAVPRVNKTVDTIQKV